MNGTEIVRAATSDYQGLSLVCSPREALVRMQELQAFVAEAMVPSSPGKCDGDYGRIPGTEKDTLLQPGAQKLCEIYGFSVSFEDVERHEDWEKGFFFYRKKCVLTLRRDGRFIGDGLGSCNSKESRYAGRWGWESEIPAGTAKASLTTRRFQGKDGRELTKYKIPNEDIFSLVNTIEKMACKRALIHATIGATRSAGVFSQDLEDLPDAAFGSVESERSWEVVDEPRDVAPALRVQPQASAAVVATQVVPPPAQTKTPPANPKPSAKAPESEAAATLPVSPPPQAPVAATPPMPGPAAASPPATAIDSSRPGVAAQGTLTIEGVRRTVTELQKGQKKALLAAKDLVEQLGRRGIGTARERAVVANEWRAKKEEVLG